MAPPTLPGPDENQDDAQWRTAGDRIQTLLDASSSGGAVAVALRVAKGLKDAVVVTVICDRGDRYLSTGVFPD